MSIRNVYLDCEFLPADLSTSGLVSIALTDDQGVDFYAVNGEMHLDGLLAVPWMVENVWPYLPRIVFGYDDHGILNHDDPAVQTIAEIRTGVEQYFAETEADATRLYAFYGGQDICRLHSLWDNNWAVMPRQIPRWFTELKTLIVDAGRPELPAQDGGEHHALADARHNRRIHEHLHRIKGGIAADPVPHYNCGWARVEPRLGGEHSCENCDGVDPASCLMNPERAV